MQSEVFAKTVHLKWMLSHLLAYYIEKVFAFYYSTR